MKKTNCNEQYAQVILILLFITILFVLSGCISATKNISETSGLYDDEGILITKIRTNTKDTIVFIHGKEAKWPLAKFEPVHPPQELRTIIIEGGEAYFSKIFWKDSFVWGSRNYFNIEPGTVTYVGDFVIETVAEKGGISIYTVVIDKEEETVKEAKKQYPWIFKKYPYRKSIPSCNQ
jgi:hypothetical protein